MNYNKYM